MRWLERMTSRILQRCQSSTHRHPLVARGSVRGDRDAHRGPDRGGLVAPGRPRVARKFREHRARRGDLGALGGRAGDHRRQPRNSCPRSASATTWRCSSSLQTAPACRGSLRERALAGRARRRRGGAHSAEQQALRHRVQRRPLDARRAAARAAQQRGSARRVRAEAAVRAFARDLPPRRRPGLDLGRRRRGAHRPRRRDADLAPAEADLERRRRDRAGRLRARARPGSTTRSATSRSRSTGCARVSARRSSS